ncbi:exo-alpha-sialidase [Streptomyces sp. SID8382]|uniref:sialidase family protein n=1 Tax=Streptomyces malaysiensis TaxID=92644 RepID=UPI000C2CDEE5|nr:MULTISPECIES: sialidase family protein [unclassified Streptomyces]AUA14274.1 Sialidase precursor [Streptomyces sp. M56]MYX54260.1 exo-alpha-sialidase [Streptomyces sp. SID8382]
MTVGTGAARSYEVSVPFRAGTEGYASYRIPAVVLTHAGTVLAFAEGRVDSSADYGRIDLVLKRSADGGRTWGALQIVARNGDGTAGNPAPVVLDGGPHDGRVLLVHIRSAASATEDRIRRGEVSAADGRRVWLTYSDDDGASWSGAREITASTKRPEWRWYATTPGHALQLRYGAHAGRIVIPGNHSLPPTVPGDDGTEGRYNGGHDLLSDDDGATWRIGYVDDNPDGYVNVNETTAAQLPDGRVYFNTRTDAEAPGNRADAHSGDGGATLDLPFRPQAGLVAPVVEGSVLHLGEPDALLFSGPADPAYRALMTVRTSHDGGVTWRPTHTVNGLPAAYSDLVRLDDATVGLLYETGDFSAYSTITFRRIPMEELV